MLDDELDLALRRRSRSFRLELRNELVNFFLFAYLLDARHSVEQQDEHQNISSLVALPGRSQNSLNHNGYGVVMMMVASRYKLYNAPHLPVREFVTSWCAANADILALLERAIEAEPHRNYFS